MNYSINAINQQSLPYNLISDVIKVKILVLEDYNLSYISDIIVDIYANFDGSEILLSSEITDEFGIIQFEFLTEFISQKNIETGQIWCKCIYNNIEYISNKTRINFIFDTTLLNDYVFINAGPLLFRINFPNTFKNIDANNIITRTLNSNSYNIYDRGII